MLRFAEELLLLSLDDASGALAPIPEAVISIALAGATLMDLALEHRIDTDPARLILIDAAPLDDDLLDPVLAEIAAAHADAANANANAAARSPDYWITRIARSGPDLKERTLSRLVQRGILEDVNAGVIALSGAVSRPRRYPMVDGEAQQEIRLRIMGILFSNDIPSPQDTAIIGLADAAGIFGHILTREELAQAAPRIRMVGQLDLLMQAVARVVAAAPVTPPVVPAAGGWPVASGLPVIGSALSMLIDPQKFIMRQYLRNGPIFELRALNRRIVVMAGPEANQFLQRSGKVHFRSREHWRAFNTEVGAAQHLMSMDGAEHTRYRRVLRRAYSRSNLERRLPTALDIARREIAAWTPGQPVPALRALKRISLEQIAVITTNTSVLDYLDDLEVYVKSLLNVRVAGRQPGFMMRRPRVRRARRRLDALYAAIMSAHQTPPGAGAIAPAREPDIIDDILDMHHTDPQLIPETDLWTACMGPYLAGVDTVSNILTFMLYALFRHPELQERVRAEADAFFAAATPNAQELRKMDVTHRVAMETLRMYPMVFPMRIVANSFDFAGYRVPAGASLMIAAGISHFLPELYPDPQQFDIERYTPGRMEQAQPGAFAPFSQGTHTCLANGFAQAQIMLIMASIFHQVELEPAAPGYRMKTRYDPMLCPDRRFALRVTRRRQGNG